MMYGPGRGRARAGVPAPCEPALPETNDLQQSPRSLSTCAWFRRREGTSPYQWWPAEDKWAVITPPHTQAHHHPHWWRVWFIRIRYSGCENFQLVPHRAHKSYLSVCTSSLFLFFFLLFRSGLAKLLPSNFDKLSVEERESLRVIIAGCSVFPC